MGPRWLDPGQIESSGGTWWSGLHALKRFVAERVHVVNSPRVDEQRAMDDEELERLMRVGVPRRDRAPRSTEISPSCRRRSRVARLRREEAIRRLRAKPLMSAREAGRESSRSRRRVRQARP